MHKLYAVWTTPTQGSIDEFEAYYLDVHCPIAAAIPGLRALDLIRTGDGSEGPTEIYRVAELVFDSAEALAAAQETPEFVASGEDAGQMCEKWGTTLTVRSGDVVAGELPAAA